MRTCSWPGNNILMRKYHDEEWCVPNYDDRFIFEMLNLEGAQAGLSWSTVIDKREHYLSAFHNFDIKYCASLTEEDFESIRLNFGIIKNRLKIKGVHTNALCAIEIQKEFGSLSNYFWSYVNHKPIINHWEYETQMPTQSDISEAISIDLKKRGFKFVGAVIIYSFMQAIGMVDDHIVQCPFHTEKKDPKV
jgi:DNA-3-methyladenine glycosylase I